MEEHLEQPQRRQHHAAEPAVAAQSTTVLPERLERSEGPAEPLPEKSAETIGRFGVTDGVAVGFDSPAVAADSPGQVHVLSHRVGRVTAGLPDRLSPPPSHRAGNDPDRIEYSLPPPAQ